MRVVLPNIHYQVFGFGLALRPRTLEGKVIGFLDGWGRRNPDGTFGMYPLMEAIWPRLRASFGVRDYVWVKKPSISTPVPRSILDEFLSQKG